MLPHATGRDTCDVLVFSTRFSPRMTVPLDASFRVVALLSAYNEADVINETIGALVADGVEVRPPCDVHVYVHAVYT